MTTEGNSRSPEPQEVIRTAIEYFIRDVNVALPGKIETYDPELQKADVKPLVQRLTATEDGDEIVESLPVIPGVPVVFPRGGGFFISMPVKKDDFCLLIFNSFSVDKYKAGTGKDTNPEDFALHDLSNAVALMGFSPFSKAIADADADNIVVGREEGTQIHVADGLIELGEKDSSDWVSRDSLVQQELNALRDSINSLVDVYNLHVHQVAAAPGPSGPPAPPNTGNPAPPIQSTQSDIVTLQG